MFRNVKPEFYIDHSPEHGRLASGKQFVLIQTQAAPADLYEALFSKCATIMRNYGVKKSRWLHCAGLWVDDMEGQAERLHGYAQQARELAGEVCGYEQGVIPRTEAIRIRR